LSAPVGARRRTLIVNADDFGRSAGVNRGVAFAHEKGIVTSASLMVRRPAAVEAAEYARSHPRLSVGLHADLGEWVFRNGAWEVVEEPPDDVGDELSRQLDRFSELVGCLPTHLDSHQHVHQREPEAAVISALAGELGLPLRGRNAHISYCGDFYGQTGKSEPMHEAISVESLLNLLTALPAGITELGCHPGVGTDDDLPYGVERSIEVAALCDRRVRAFIDETEISLRSFTDFDNGRCGAGW